MSADDRTEPDPFSERPDDESGVDRSVVRWMLSLSPTERLRRLEQQAAFVARARASSASRDK